MSHHSLIQYRLPATGELVPLLQIVPSKTDEERLLVISPELADVLAAVVTRVREPGGGIPLVAAYDYNEKVWNPPMPLLFQWHFRLEDRPLGPGVIRRLLNDTLAGSGLADAGGAPLRFTPHDFRRLFITDAVMHGMPPHIAQLVAGHRDINTTMGYKAVYPEEVINGHRAFIARRRSLRPSEEYRTPERRRVGGVPRPLRATARRARRMRAVVLRPLHPRAQLPAMPAPAAIPGPAAADHRDPRQPPRPHRRGRTRRMARRGRGPESQPHRGRRQARPARPDGPPGRHHLHRHAGLRRHRRPHRPPHRQGPPVTSPDTIATALRNHAEGSRCLAAAAELLIAQAWLDRDDFASRFVTICPSPGSGKPMAVIDWPDVVGALGTSLPCSGGEQRMLKLTASLADGIPVDLRDTLTGLDDRNIQLLVTAIRHASGKLT